MQESTRRHITRIVVGGLALILTIFVVHQRGAMNRAVNTLAEGQPAERVEIVRQLVNSGRLAAVVEEQPRWVQDRAVAAALCVGTPRAYGQLVQIIPLVDNPVADQIQASLKMVGPRAVGPAAQNVSDQDDDIRAAAATVLGQIGAPSVPTLVSMLGVYDDDTRAAVQGALIGV